MRAGLWIVQILLALFAIAAGVNHGLRPLADVARTSPWSADVPVPLLRFIGWCEMAAGVGLVLPAATGILPVLTPLAAIGLGIVMGLAIPFHIMRGESHIIGLHATVVVLCAFVAWGRLSRPVHGRR